MHACLADYRLSTLHVRFACMGSTRMRAAKLSMAGKGRSQHSVHKQATHTACFYKQAPCTTFVVTNVPCRMRSYQAMFGLKMQ